jgi:hypothetical protein
MCVRFRLGRSSIGAPSNMINSLKLLTLGIRDSSRTETSTHIVTTSRGCVTIFPTSGSSLTLTRGMYEAFPRHFHRASQPLHNLNRSSLDQELHYRTSALSDVSRDFVFRSLKNYRTSRASPIRGATATRAASIPPVTTNSMSHQCCRARSARHVLCWKAICLAMMDQSLHSRNVQQILASPSAVAATIADTTLLGTLIEI